MIRKADERTCVSKQFFGAPGVVYVQNILNGGEFAGKGRLFAHNVIKPGMGLGDHTHHGEFEVYYILKGVGTYNDNGTEILVHPGDVTVCPDGETHGIYNNGTEDLEFIALIVYTTKTDA